MTDKEYFIDFWTPTVGAEEAARAWEVKQSQMRIAAPMVMTDIQPYQSMITGEMITSRSQHKAHLKTHKCIEIGNETKYLNPKEKIELSSESKARRKEMIIHEVSKRKG